MQNKTYSVYCLLTKPVILEGRKRESFRDTSIKAIKSRELATATNHSSGEHYATSCTSTARPFGRATINLCHHSKYKDVNYRSIK